MAIGGSFLPPVVAHLVADIGQFTAAMGTARAEMGTLAAANAKLAAVGKVAMIGLGVAVAAVGYESVKLAMNFDQTLELIHTQAGAAQSEVEGMRKAVLDLAPAVGIGPEKLAEGLYHIESTGFRGKEALDILAASARLAAMGLADLDTVTFAMSGTMAVGMKDIRDAADATNYLNTIVGMGDMRMEKLASAIGTGILPAFKSAGLGMMDFGASIATITDNSVGADEAATRLRMTISMMAAPSGPAIKALKSIGLGQYDLANDMRQPNGLLVATEDLKKHLEESGLTAVEQNAVIARAFGGGRTSSAIQTLLGETERLRTKYEQLGDAESRAKKANEAWAEQQKQFKQQLHELSAQLQVWGIKIGNWLIPKIQSAVSWMSKHTEAVKIAAIAIGSILVVAIYVWIAAMVEAAIATIAATWPILLIILAIAALGVGIYLLVKHWDTAWGFIKKIAMDVWQWLLWQWHGIWDDGIKKGAIAVWGWLVSAWHATIHGLAVAVAWVKNDVIDPMAHFFEAYLLGPIRVTMHVVAGTWRWAWSIIRAEALFAAGFLKAVWQSIAGHVMAIVMPAIHWLQQAWDVVWGALTRAAAWGMFFISETLLGLQMVWDVVWGAIVASALWVWNNVLLPTWNAIVQFGINPIVAAVHWLRGEWDIVWKWCANAVSVAWDWMKVIWGYIKRDGIEPVQSAAHSLADTWDMIWHAIGGALSWVWEHMIKPVFDKIKSGIDSIKKGFNDVKSAPGAAGKALAGFLPGFDSGGWVGGAPGEATLAIVHGGEYVLSRDMIAAGAGAKPIGAAPGAAGRAGGGGHSEAALPPIKLYVDGQELHVVMIPHAQRYKQRTGTTGLS